MHVALLGASWVGLATAGCGLDLRGELAEIGDAGPLSSGQSSNGGPSSGSGGSSSSSSSGASSSGDDSSSGPGSDDGSVLSDGAGDDSGDDLTPDGGSSTCDFAGTWATKITIRRELGSARPDGRHPGARQREFQQWIKSVRVVKERLTTPDPAVVCGIAPAGLQRHVVRRRRDLRRQLPAFPLSTAGFLVCCSYFRNGGRQLALTAPHLRDDRSRRRHRPHARQSCRPPRHGRRSRPPSIPHGRQPRRHRRRCDGAVPAGTAPPTASSRSTLHSGQSALHRDRQVTHSPAPRPTAITSRARRPFRRFRKASVEWQVRFIDSHVIWSAPTRRRGTCSVSWY